MTKAGLQKYGEKLAYEYSEHLRYKHEKILVSLASKYAFNQALELLFPLVETMERYKSAAFDIDGKTYAVGSKAKEALAELEKKVRGR